MSRLLGAQTKPGLLAYAAHGFLRICTGGEQAEVVVGVILSGTAAGPSGGGDGGTTMTGG